MTQPILSPASLHAARRFHNICRVLLNVDLHDLKAAGIITGESGGSDWERFNNDPLVFMLKIDDERFEKLWRLLEEQEGRRHARFQARVQPWLVKCFDDAIVVDRQERCARLLEETIELTQALGHTREAAHKWVDYVYDRPAGDAAAEVGGVMVALAAACIGIGVDMADAAEIELERISTPEMIAKIRAKWADKPRHSHATAPVDAEGSAS